MKYYKLIFFSFLLQTSFIFSAHFTISSYNCGGLSDHYDYLRSATMQKIMQERYTAEPKLMALNEKIQKIALRALFKEQKYHLEKCQKKINFLIKSPDQSDSPNTFWYKKTNESISDYKVRPVLIKDEEINQLLQDHLQNSSLEEKRASMAKKIFHHHLKHDILCLQEADYLDSSMFSEEYQVQFSDTDHSKNGIAWKKNRFEIIENLGLIGRSFVILLLDKDSQKKILVASSHLTGCNPYMGGEDSEKGDQELKVLVEFMEENESDLKLIGMDSNVTSLHPRLEIIKNAKFQMDTKNFIEATCSNPYQVLNTRIDWIVIKGKATITNLPVLGIGLNSIETNISDHKPIAAKVKY